MGIPPGELLKHARLKHVEESKDPVRAGTAGVLHIGSNGAFLHHVGRFAACEARQLDQLTELVLLHDGDIF
jgi:hypothetical protein